MSRALALSSSIVLVALASHAPLAQAARSDKGSVESSARVAVLEFQGGGLAPGALSAITDEARAGALDAVKDKGMLVMTRESMSAIVADMGKCASEGACEVETARTIGATYVVTGDVTKLGKTLSLSLKLLDVKTGALLATRSIDGKDASALKGALRAETRALLDEGVGDDAALAGETSGGADAEPPAAALTGASSARLAKPVVITYGKEFPKGELTLVKQDGKATSQVSDVPSMALRRYARAIARRHFEDASFTAPASSTKKGKKGEPVRELVVQSVVVVVNQGPSYQARVVVDRVQDGKRLGQATGQGFAMPDRTTERQRAAFVPGVFGLAASHKASQANADKDAAAIETAVVQALDSACLQLAAYWSGEQMIEDMNKKR